MSFQKGRLPNKANHRQPFPLWPRESNQPQYLHFLKTQNLIYTNLRELEGFGVNKKKAMIVIHNLENLKKRTISNFRNKQPSQQSID